ncbi:MAG: S8 family serine peptidase, partial [candidate division Zixibacteria bacterium]
MKTMSQFKNGSWCIMLVIIAALFVVSLGEQSLAGEPKDPGQTDHQNPDDALPPVINYVEGEIVIRFADGVTPSTGLGYDADTLAEGYLPSLGIYLLSYDTPVDLEDSALRYSELDGIIYAQPNYLISEIDPVQGSYPFSDLSGSGSYADQDAANSLGLTAAHGIADGTGIRVGIVDGGVDFSHPAFTSAGVGGYDFVDDDVDPMDKPDGEISGHGTFVAGVVQLVAPQAELAAYRVFDENGFGNGFDVALAIFKAVEEGCDVINLSLVLKSRHLAVRDAINYAVGQGVAVIAAAGNNAQSGVVYPAAEAGAIAVAAIDSQLTLADFSNYGDYIDVCAPGTEVYSAYQNDLYAWWSGTSFAAPFGSGQAALLAQTQVTADANLLRLAIIATAVELDSNNPAYSGLLGNGVVDPVSSLAQIDNLAYATVS